MKRKSLLNLLVERYPDRTRERLMALILCRDVVVDGGRINDPKYPVREDAVIEIHEGGYVSRGGMKLAHALDSFGIDPQGKVFIDAGSSTGGFTDCLLQREAAYIHAVDVGYNQLAYRLRTHAKVHVMEQTNILSVEGLQPAAHAAVADLSFRSIAGAASHILSLCSEGWMIALIKPQFELQHHIQDFDGVLRSSDDILRVLLGVYDALSEESVSICRLEKSPITGTKGNREYLSLLRFSDAAVEKISRTDILHLI